MPYDAAPSPSPPSPADTALPADDGLADFGVLLVHGIGDAAEGDTLLSFGEPLFDWMRERLIGRGAGADGGTLQVARATLRAPRWQDDIPAHACVRVSSTPQQGPATHQEWVFAEAWWAGIVRPPAPARLLLWMLSRIPLMLLWHLHARSAGRWDPQLIFGGKLGPRQFVVSTLRMGEVFALLGVMACSALLAFVLQAVTLLALAVIWVPIGRWRSAVLDAVRVLTLTLGDSYVLLEQDFQRAALAERVRHALGWLSSHCARVMVIAHSQGGAVAHEALQSAPLGRVDSLLTVGSGLEKLEFLRLVRERRQGLISATWAGPTIALALVLPLTQALGWVQGASIWWLAPSAVLGYVGLGFLSNLLNVLRAYYLALEQRSKGWPLADGARPIAWYDAYASLDLVPQGRSSQLVGLAEQRCVANEWSLVFDHIRYFQTRCGFASWCWQLMDRRSGLGAIGADESFALDRLQRWHSRRGLALSIGAWAAPAGVALAVLLMPSLLVALGKGFLDLLATAELGMARRALQGLSEGLASAWAWLPGIGTDAQALADRAHVVAGTLPLLAAVVVWWLLILAAWRRANEALWRRVCAGKSHLVRRLSVRQQLWWGHLPLVGWAALGMAPLLIGGLSPLTDRVPGLAALGVISGAVLAGVLAVAGLALAAANPWIVALLDGQFDFGRATRPLVATLYGFIAVAAGSCGDMLWQALYGRSYGVELAVGLAAAGTAGWAVWWVRRRARLVAGGP